MARTRKADVQIENHGSIFLFTPMNETAREWMRANIYDPILYGSSWAVEHRYAWDLAEGMKQDGLICR